MDNTKTPNIKMITKGIGPDSITFACEDCIHQSKLFYRVEEIKEEIKYITTKDCIRVYRMYHSGKLIYEVESNSALTIFYYI